MNLINLRDRIRAKALEAGLSYSEIEGLTDVNELLNQQMPCLMFNYEQETNNFSTPSTLVTPRIYLINTIFDAELTETGEYQRDWIINKKNELRNKYIDWIKLMQLDGSSYIEVTNDTQLQMQQRVSVEGFLIMEALPQFKVSREFCLLTEEGGVTPPSCDPANYIVQYEDGTLIEQGTIPSGGSKTIEVPNVITCDVANWQLTDSLGNVLDSGTIASGGSATIVAPDADYLVQYQNGTLIESGVIPSGGSKIIDVPNVIQDLQLNIFVNETDDFVEFTATASMVGSIRYADFGSLTNGVIRVNTTIVTVPFAIALNDVVRLEFDSAVSNDVIILEGSYV